MDLVDDDGLDPRKCLPHLGGEHQIEGLGRRDQEVGRVLGQLSTFHLAGVTGSEGDPWFVEGRAQPFGGEADALEWAPQVLLDVDCECAQWRDVEDAGAMVLVIGRRGAGELVDAPEEGREGLARTGRSKDQCVVTRCDARPPLRLRRRGFGERGAEPLGSGRAEALEHRMHPVLATPAAALGLAGHGATVPVPTDSVPAQSRTSAAESPKR